MQVFNVKDFGAVGDGITDDTAAIQAALDAADEAGGGTVVIPEGTFIISSAGRAAAGSLQIHSNTELTGAGMGETILKLADGSDTKISGLIRTAPAGEVDHDIVIRDLTIDGNKANTSGEVDGLMTGYQPGSALYEYNILIDSVEIMNCSRIGFNPHEQTKNLTIRNSVAHDNDWDGFIADYVSDSVYENNVAYNNGRHGFNVVTHSSDMILRNNVAYGNGENGIVLQRGSADAEYISNVLVENNTVFRNGTHGIELKRVDDSQIINNIIYENAEDGIHIEASNDNIIAGNEVRDNSRAHPGENDGIRVQPYSGSQPGPTTSTGNIIADNTIIADKYASESALSETTYGTSGNIFRGNVISGTYEDDADDTVGGNDADAPVYHFDRLQDPRTVGPNAIEAPFHQLPSETSGVSDVETPIVGNGTSGDDGVYGGAGNDTLNGREGDDVVKGGAGLDTLYGHLGDDMLLGGDGHDTLTGNDGADILVGGAGIDMLTGGAGNDTFVFDALGEGIDTVVDFRQGDRIDLNGVLPEFSGSVIDALLDGYIRFSQDGGDVVLRVDVDGAEGAADWEAVAVFQNLTLDAVDIRQVMLDGYDNAVSTSASVKFLGTGGADSYSGRAGDDKLTGGNGNDGLSGGAGADILLGGNGDDRLYGGLGNDFLQGGAGADTYVFRPDNGSDIVDGLDASDTLIFSKALFVDEAAVRAAFVDEGNGMFHLETVGGDILFQNTSQAALDGVTIAFA